MSVTTLDIWGAEAEAFFVSGAPCRKYIVLLATSPGGDCAAYHHTHRLLPSAFDAVDDLWVTFAAAYILKH